MAHRRRGQVVALSAAASALMLFTGCGAEPVDAAPPMLVVVSAGGRANTCQPTVTPELETIVEEVVRGRGRVTTVAADGDPRVVASLQLQNTGNNPSMQERQDATNRATVKKLLGEVSATVGQANQLQAIGLAAGALTDGPGQRILVVVDSALQTMPPLRFEDGSLLSPATDAEAVAEFVASQGAVPDLTGVRVVWFFTQTASPQPTLTIPAQTKLRDIWRAVLGRAHASSLEFQNAVGPCTAADGPEVAVVPVPDLQDAGRQTAPSTGSTSSSDVGTSRAATPGEPRPPVAAPFSADRLTFQPDSANFADQGKALQEVRAIADDLSTGGYGQIHITGTTADVGDRPGQLRLSLDRASAVRDLLVKAGVSAAAITSVEGVGSDFPGHVPEFNPDGTFNDRLAALNRLVIVSADA